MIIFSFIRSSSVSSILVRAVVNTEHFLETLGERQECTTVSMHNVYILIHTERQFKVANMFMGVGMKPENSEETQGEHAKLPTNSNLRIEPGIWNCKPTTSPLVD